MIEVLWHTLAARPYVWVFMAAFLATAVPSLGRKRAALFLVTGYIVAFASEFCSIRNGFPYGPYFYRYDNLDPLELVVGGRPPVGSPVGTPAGVPFFDSLSYSFMAYASYMLALFFTAPLFTRDRDLRLADTRANRTSDATWFLATFFMGLLDVIVDPVAFQGDRWFLGKIYGYAEDGAYFHVPFSNQLGWWLVAAVTFYVVLKIDALWIPRDTQRRLPFRALLGPGIWIGCAAFNIIMAFRIGETGLGFSGLYILAPIVALLGARALGAGGRASPEEIAAHERDNPDLC
ncbi:MAG TPA: carotenoid biosynthesis protein [Planctomycetota bacterium]|nr:carotenoid biosynthesis protein [Planctomycetota bacterium]